MAAASSFSKSSSNVTIRRKRQHADNDTDSHESTNNVEQKNGELTSPTRKRAIYSCDSVPPTSALPTISSPSFSTVVNLTSSSLPLLLFSSCPIPQLVTSKCSTSLIAKKKVRLAQTRSISTENWSIHQSPTQPSAENSCDDSTKITAETSSTRSEFEVSLSNKSNVSVNSMLSPHEEPMRLFPSVDTFISSAEPASGGSTMASLLSPSIESTSTDSNTTTEKQQLLNSRLKSPSSRLNVSLSWKASATHSFPNDDNAAKMTRHEMLQSSGHNQPKPKKRIHFGRLKVYYFARAQGFVTVPATGSVALGMERHHHIVKDYSFFEFNKANRLEQAQKCARWQKAASAEIRSRSCSRIDIPVTLSEDSSSESLLSPSTSTELNNNFDQTLAVERCLQSLVAARDERNRLDTPNLDETLPYRDGVPAIDGIIDTAPCADASLSLSFSQPSNEFNECCFTMDNELDEPSSSPASSSTYSSDEDVTDEFLQLETQFQPIRSRIRRTILQASGVNIDTSVRDEHRMISRSRMSVGCDCVDGVCDPSTCACALLGIGCQVDRKAFPCACKSNDSCKNPEGRIEYDPSKVHAHYIHTMMRLKTIRKHGLEDSPLSISPLRIKFTDREDDMAPAAQKCDTDATECSHATL